MRRKDEKLISLFAKLQRVRIEWLWEVIFWSLHIWGKLATWEAKVFCAANQGETLHCIAEIRAYWVENKTFCDRQPSTSLPNCLTMLPLFVFIWWEDFLKVSRKCVGWELEGFSFRLNGWQQYCTRNYEKKCNLYIKIKRSQLHKPIEILCRKINYTNWMTSSCDCIWAFLLYSIICTAW